MPISLLSSIIAPILLLVVSLFLIWKSSDWITDSLIPLARKLGTSYIAITTLLVSIVISLPEVIISLYSFLLGHPALGVGVIIGSVMANIGLTVGLSATFKPLWVEKSVAIREGIVLVVCAVIVLLFGMDLQYQRPEGWVLLLLFLPYALNVWYFEKRKPHHYRRQKIKRLQQNLSLLSMFPRLKLKKTFLTFIIGGAVLLLGSYLFSFSLIELNSALHFPEMLLGITFGALGPALPNIAAAIQGTRRGIKDAAITETFGSNIFTLLITLGLMIVLNPLTIAASVFYFDLTWMIMINLLMVAFIFKGYRYKEASLTRLEGIVLLVFYLVLLAVQGVWF